MSFVPWSGLKCFEAQSGHDSSTGSTSHLDDSVFLLGISAEAVAGAYQFAILQPITSKFEATF